jgi:hypothetical protein
MSDSITAKDTTIANLLSELAILKASVPELETRQYLQHKLDAMTDRLFARDKQVALLKRDLAMVKEENTNLHAQSIKHKNRLTTTSITTSPVLVSLQNKTVLCVGGRSGNIANYRGVIEQVGGHFAHHDGGQEDNASLLDASLAAADLIICQTGCISHNAYWRVKDHCRRTGKRCVFVDNPQCLQPISLALKSTGPHPCTRYHTRYSRCLRCRGSTSLNHISYPFTRRRFSEKKPVALWQQKRRRFFIPYSFYF